MKISSDDVIGEDIPGKMLLLGLILMVISLIVEIIREIAVRIIDKRSSKANTN